MRRLGDRTTSPDSCVILKLFDNTGHSKEAHSSNKPHSDGLVWRGAEQAVISLNAFSPKFNFVIFSAIHFYFPNSTSMQWQRIRKHAAG